MAVPRINIVPPTAEGTPTTAGLGAAPFSFPPAPAAASSAPSTKSNGGGAGGTGVPNTPAGPSLSADERRLLTLTYGDLLTFLTDPLSATLTPASLSRALTDRLPALTSPSTPFGKPFSTSKAELDKPNIRGLPISKEEKDFLQRFSTTWEVDELQAFMLWKSHSSAYGVPPLQRAKEGSTAIADEQEHSHAFLLFILEERLNVFRILAALLRSAANESDPVSPLARELIGKIFKPYEEHQRKILSAFQDLCTSPLPAAVQAREHRSLAPLLARQRKQEQILLLELLFLANYLQPPSASLTQEIFSSLYTTQLGSAHDILRPYLMDDPGLSLVRATKIASILLAVGILNLESLWSAELVLSEQAGTTLLTNPDAILSIQETLLTTPPDPAYAPIVLGWSVLLHTLSEIMFASDDIPDLWLPLVRAIAPDAEKGPATRLPDQRTAFEEFASVALDPGMQLFATIDDILSQAPFDTSPTPTPAPSSSSSSTSSASSSNGTTTTAAAAPTTQEQAQTAALLSPLNTLAYRSVLKGLLLSIPTLLQLPFLGAQLDAYLSCLCTLLSRGPALEIAPLALQFWESDARDPQRSAILSLLSARAPLSFSMLLKLLTALCGNGSPSSSDDPPPLQQIEEPIQQICALHAYRYLSKRRSFALLLQPADIGLLWEAGPKGWVTKKPMSFPGGGIVEADAVGVILNQGDGREGVVVSWPVQWNALQLVLELLKAFAAKYEQGSSSSNSSSARGRRTLPPSVEERRRARVVNLQLSEVQVEPGVDETELVATSLDLLATLLRANPALAEELDTLFGPAAEKVPHPFLELVLRLLELVFLRTNPRAPPPLRLITPLLTILASVAYSGTMSVRLAAYLRSAGVFAVGGAFSRLVASEQILGTYSGTLDLIRLISAVVEDARMHQFAMREESTHALKSQVLQQALTFLLRDIWGSFLGWRYSSLTERLLLAQKMMGVFISVLEDWALAPVSSSIETPYRPAVQMLTSALLGNQAAITPLTAILTSAPETMLNLAKAKRTIERDLLCNVVERALKLVQVSLLRKGQVQQSGLTTLENAVFSIAATPRRSLRTRPAAGGLVQLLFDYVTTPYPGSSIQLQAAKTLYIVCRSIRMAPSPPSFVGSLDDAEVTVRKLVEDILQNAMAPTPLRIAVWDFASAAIDTQQAIGSIFLSGSLRNGLALSQKARGKQSEATKPTAHPSAVEAALAILKDWEQPIDDEFSLVAAALNFLDVCWRQFDQFSDLLEQYRKDVSLWKTLTAIAAADLGPAPAAEEFKLFPTVETAYRSSAHEKVANYSDRLLIKAHAVHLLSLGVTAELNSSEGSKSSLPETLKDLETLVRGGTKLNDVLSKAIESPYSPALMAGVAKDLKPFTGFDADLLRPPSSSEQRQGGDDYLYSLDEVFIKIRGYPLDPVKIGLALKRACALNLTWSLLDRHVALTASWQALLEAGSSWIVGQSDVRSALISTVAFLAKIVAQEKRDGDTMAIIHSTRINLLQALVGGVGLPSGLPATAQTNLYSIMGSIRMLVVHENFPAIESFRGRHPRPYHRQLLQVIQWCGRLLSARDMVKLRTASQWTIVSSAMTATLEFLIEALRGVFADAIVKGEGEPSTDLELLVTMFDRCTQAELHPVPALWLSLCEDADLIRISLEVLALTDIGGVNTNPTRRLLHPRYANHVLAFHMALTKAGVAAEALARAGVLSVYTENCLTPVLERGEVMPREPEDIGRSKAHEAWCLMLSVTTALLSVTTQTSELLEAKVVMLVQSYGRQLTGALGWKVEESLSLPLLEELERTVAFFYTMSIRSTTEQEFSSPTWALLSVYSEKALGLLQQLNYAVTHPNHTFSLLVPFSPEEEAFFDGDEQINASRSSAEMIDPAKRPALAALMQRLFLITRDIMSSLTALSRPDAVIRSTEIAEWWIPARIHAPTATAAVSIDEPASLGTLLELGNVARDTLSAIITLPDYTAAIKPVPPCTAACLPFDKALCTSALRETLEMLLLYITAEITRGIYSGLEGEAVLAGEDPDSSATSARRGKASATTDPAQRALRGELLAELRELLSKASALFEKMDGRGKQGGIVPVLSAHVQKRLSGVAA